MRDRGASEAAAMAMNMASHDVIVPSRLVMPGQFPMSAQQQPKQQLLTTPNSLITSPLTLSLPPGGLISSNDQVLHSHNIEHSSLDSDQQQQLKNMMLLMREPDEYESKSSSDNVPDAASGEEQDGAHERPSKKRYHRHSQHQIQEMERVFKECPHPDEKQRLELSKELKLDPRQVKFWFQNKRTQVKAQHERHDNAFLRTENEKLRAENLALRDAIANVACPNCGGPANLADVSFDEQQLRIENVRLREEIDRISTIAAKHVGRPISTLNLSSTVSPSSTANSTLNFPAIQPNQGAKYSNLGDNEAPKQPPLMVNFKPVGLSESEKPMVAELAVAAMEELTQVAQASEPLWLLDPHTGMEVMDHQHYLQRFPHTIVINHNTTINNATNPANSKRESTRETTLIMMDAASLVDILMDVASWADMFACIVSRAFPIEVLSSGADSTRDGAMQIIYAEFQLPSPMVSTRESYFLRYAKRMSHNHSVWVVVDVSIDSLTRTNPSSTRCRRRPSGCIIEEMPDGYSKVTWVEHSEVDNIKGVHRLYQQLVSSGMAFGAQRWLATLRRQCDGMHAASHSITNTTRDVVSPTMEGRRSILKLSERMTRNFCGGVSASAAHTWITLSAADNSTNGAANAYNNMGDDVRVLIRKSVDDPGRPPGVVLCAATCIWLPIAPSRVFDFLRDDRFRAEWDILSNMGVVEEVVHVPKGQDNGNSISLLRVNAVSSNQPNMLILQECCAEETSYMVVYAPVDTAAMSAVLNGGDQDCVALLPSGFSILPDRPQHHRLLNSDLGTPTSTPFPSSSSSSSSAGSLLTVAFQILVDHVPTAKLSLGSVATVNNLISSTVLRIKNALACDTACMS